MHDGGGGGGGGSFGGHSGGGHPGGSSFGVGGHHHAHSAGAGWAGGGPDPSVPAGLDRNGRPRPGRAARSTRRIYQVVFWAIFIGIVIWIFVH